MPDEHEPCSPPLADVAGDRMRELRARRRMTQAALAREMSRRGFRWHQTTVARIEGGSQLLALIEAAALAEVFAVPLDVFLTHAQAA
jgi:transcriptional regulator with XRE-family HTH domain